MPSVMSYSVLAVFCALIVLNVATGSTTTETVDTTLDTTIDTSVLNPSGDAEAVYKELKPLFDELLKGVPSQPCGQRNADEPSNRVRRSVKTKVRNWLKKASKSLPRLQLQPLGWKR
uniref:Secreted protein n=1 Tax=Panagrellus redivivus TaxID=6233 RepID=A0A7E4VKJ1_PANRE